MRGQAVPSCIISCSLAFPAGRPGACGYWHGARAASLLVHGLGGGGRWVGEGERATLRSGQNRGGHT